MDSRSNEKNLRQAEFFSNRLRKNEKNLRSWIRRESIHALRLYDKDIPEIPLAVDRYDSGDRFALVMQLYERPYEKPEEEEASWLELMKETASTTLGIPGEMIFLKTRRRMRGMEQYDRTDNSRTCTMVIEESGLRFSVNLSEYLDTGLFLDHRPSRKAIGASSRGKSVLNLFSYTGSFSVYAASGGASRVVSVDLSNTYLAWAKNNFSLNNLASNIHTTVRSDVMEFLSREKSAGSKWDLIIADPPTFSNSSMAKEDFDVNRDWPKLLEACASVLAPNGAILFSTNSRSLKWEPSRVKLPWFDVSQSSIPPDFRNGRIHSCWIIGNHDSIMF
jgi:23S rRNA (cytosine1962-C5)-methyltransferase